jgi:hypothetical protein
MNDDDKQGFYTCVVGAAEMADKTLSKHALKLYWESLKHLEIAAVKDAFTRWLQNPDNGQFMPKPADIIRMVSGSNLDGAMLAWSTVEAAIRSVGPYASVVFDDEITMAVIADMGGWPGLCSVTEDELKFRGNEFNNRYKGMKITGRTGHPKKLIGLAELHNSSEGQAVDDPVLIGDSKKALLVHQSGRSEHAVARVSLADAVMSVAEKLDYKP